MPSHSTTPLYGFWACTDIDGCCYNNNGSTMNPPHYINPDPIPPERNGKPEGANLAINFSGMAGINQVNTGVPPFGEVTAAEVPACAGMDHCWLNLGGGFGGSPGIDHPVTLDRFRSLRDNAAKIKQLGYTGVSFDYESDVDGLTYEDWENTNSVLQKHGLDTALTVDKAGTGIGLKFGLGCTPESPGELCNIAKNIPFTYNIPQLYGGYPLFYTGEYNDDWPTQKFTGYQKPDCTGKPEAPKGPKWRPKAGEENCFPLWQLCSSSLHRDTKLLPTFGGQAPGKDMFEHIGAFFCPNHYDGKSFVSWNILDPTEELTNPNGNNCLVKCDPQKQTPHPTCPTGTICLKNGVCGAAPTPAPAPSK